MDIISLKHFLIFVGITLPPAIIECYFKTRKRKPLSKWSVDNSNYNCVFTSVKTSGCKRHIYNKSPCAESCSYNLLKKIIAFIKTAKCSVCLCMYFFTSFEIAEALETLNERNVQIRFITDQEMRNIPSSRVDFLKSKGIQMKVQPKDGSLMHHKFCLLDERTPQAKMFVGSLNLTLQALTANFDDLVFTDNPQIIAQLANEFEEMWKSFAFI